MRTAESTALSGEAFERRKDGLGSLFDICLFQYRIREAFAVKGLPPVDDFPSAKHTCIHRIQARRSEVRQNR